MSENLQIMHLNRKERYDKGGGALRSKSNKKFFKEKN